MTRCEDFYKKFKDEGNFCNKSPELAKAIMRYIDYRKRNSLENENINFNALEPFIQIEGEMLHDAALKKLKDRLKRGLEPEDVSRRLSLEIIKKTNDQMIAKNKLGGVPDIRKKFRSFEHAIYGIDYDTRELFDELKEKGQFESNDSIMRTVLRYCMDNFDRFKEYASLKVESTENKQV